MTGKYLQTTAHKSERRRTNSTITSHTFIIISCVFYSMYHYYLLCVKTSWWAEHTVIEFSALQVSSWCGGRVSWWHGWSVRGHDTWRGPQCPSPASGHPAQPRPFPHPAHQTQRAQRTPRQVVTTATTRLRTRPPPCDRWESVIQQNCKSETVNEWTSNQLPRAPPESGLTDRLHRLVFQNRWF